MTQKLPPSWLEFLNPEVTRPRLIAASVYVAAFEALKDAIVRRIREFYSVGFDESGGVTDPKYVEVLRRNRSPVYASLAWLKDEGAIDEADIESFNRLKLCRNCLAHELLATLWSTGLPKDFEDCFAEMLRLFRKIELWWVLNVEIPTNPDFDGRDIDPDQVVPGSVASLQALLDIAFGDAEVSQSYLTELEKHQGPR